MNNASQERIGTAISRVLMINTVIAGVIALAIFVALTGISIWAILKNTPVEDKIPSELTNWGGVIIGFYFGSALTQTAALISAQSRQSQKDEDQPQS